MIHRFHGQNMRLPRRENSTYLRGGENYPHSVMCGDASIADVRICREGDGQEGGMSCSERGERFYQDNTNLPPTMLSRGGHPPFYLPLGTIVGNQAATLPALVTSFICRAEPPHGQTTALCRWSLSCRAMCSPHRKGLTHQGPQKS